MEDIYSERRKLYFNGFKKILLPILGWSTLYALLCYLIVTCYIPRNNTLYGVLIFIGVFLAIKLIWQVVEFLTHLTELEKYLETKYKKSS